MSPLWTYFEGLNIIPGVYATTMCNMLNNISDANTMHHFLTSHQPKSDARCYVGRRKRKVINISD